jgi:cobalamin biosynthesis Co2+ chelatase CbiK
MGFIDWLIRKFGISKNDNLAQRIDAIKETIEQSCSDTDLLNSKIYLDGERDWLRWENPQKAR